VGVAPVWFVQDLIPCYVITRHDGVVAAFKDMETFSPELTQSYFTFPATGQQILGFEGQKHIQFRKVASRNFNRTLAKNYIADIFTPARWKQ
jgi:cytochrome P450